jgi:hypothetical protein
MARIADRDPAQAGVWSTGEQCAVALLCNKAEILPAGYTFLDAVDRLMGDPILDAAIRLGREGWRQ